MATTFRDATAMILSLGADSLRPGSGKAEVRAADVHLGDIQRLVGRDLAGVVPEFASRVFAADSDPGGSKVTIDKVREGILVITEVGVILSNFISLARTRTRVFVSSDCAAEAITFTAKRASVPGIRIRTPIESVVLGLRPIAGASDDEIATFLKAMIDQINGAVSPEEGRGP